METDFLLCFPFTIGHLSNAEIFLISKVPYSTNKTVLNLQKDFQILIFIFPQKYMLCVSVLLVKVLLGCFQVFIKNKKQ